MNKPTITVFIPVYNEENNIIYLINSILKQSQNNFTFEKIVVISDGCTDNTVRNAKTIESNLLEIIDHHENKGVTKIVNEACCKFDSDFIYKVDSDFELTDNTIISTMIDRMYKTNSFLCFNRIIYKKPKSFFQKILYFEQLRYGEVLDLIEDKDHLFTSGSYLIKKELYGKINIPDRVYAEDWYIYTFALHLKMSVTYLDFPRIEMLYPINLRHHIYQRYRWSSNLDKGLFFEFKMENKIIGLNRIRLKVLIKTLIKRPIKLIYRITVSLLSIYITITKPYLYKPKQTWRNQNKQ